MTSQDSKLKNPVTSQDNKLENLMMSQDTLSDEQKTSIDIAFIKLFVCDKLSWHLVEYPFFVKFVQQLRPAYCLLICKTLDKTLQNNEVLQFFQDVYDLINIIKPVKDAITFLEKQDTNFADCFLGLAQLEAAIKLISGTEYKMFRYYCIKVFNFRFKEFDFDEHLLAYYLHLGY
ncbi:4158_t:CDS:2 [Racocetra fulgida]|uniref:4158_t:CDS:1 n=1 Tax=Racocetra fulgida TaxID=60492 RepID=A0A9N8ZTS0_9GLOM|nr:4158_t:CDS:2 [Racocetra fulgida]